MTKKLCHYYAHQRQVSRNFVPDNFVPAIFNQQFCSRHFCSHTILFRRNIVPSIFVPVTELLGNKIAWEQKCVGNKVSVNHQRHMRPELLSCYPLKNVTKCIFCIWYTLYAL